MLTKLYDTAFDPVTLNEEDIRMFEETIHTTAQQDVSNLNTLNYQIETRSGLSESAIYLKDAYLLVRFQFADIDGTDPDPASVASLTHGAWSLFSEVSLNINQTPIDRVRNPGQVFNILTKASKSHSWLIDNCHDTFYYPANVGGGIDPDLASQLTLSNVGTDSNFLVGVGRLTSGNENWVKLRLSDVLGFTNQEKLLTGVNVVLNLQKNTDYASFIMRTNAGPDVNLITVIHEIKLYIPAVKVKSRLAEKLNLKLLEDKPQPLNWNQIGYQELRGIGTDLSLNLFTSGRRISHLFVMPQLRAQATTQLNGNASLGVVNVVNESYVMMNGQQFPAVKYKGASEGYLREIANLRRAFNTHRDNSSITNVSNFANGNAIYYFDLSHIDEQFSENQKDVVLQLHFGSAEIIEQSFHCVYFTNQSHKLQNIGGSLQIASSA